MEIADTISIVIASDEHYAILIAALIKSVEVNHKSHEHIDFYIIDDGISSKTKTKLTTIADQERVSLKWVKSNKVIPPDVIIPIDTSSYPLNIYLRLFAPYIVDKNVKKLIYLDVDIILQTDISKLWNIHLGDNIIAAVQDLAGTISCEWSGIPNYRELGLNPDAKYFNSGVLLIDIEKWKTEQITSKVITTIKKSIKFVILPDQYGLNVVLLGKWLELDAKWNWFAFKPDEGAFLIHFLYVKPIFKSYSSQEVYRKAFFGYLNMTPWKNLKPINGYRQLTRKLFTKTKKNLMILWQFISPQNH